jgi:hypothetical protein
MAAFDAGRLSRLFRERAGISSQRQEAERAAQSLTLAHNKLVRQADQAAAGSYMRDHLLAEAQNKGREAEQARKRVERLVGEFHNKEIEIADMIAALWAASQSLLSAETVRRLDDSLAEISRRLGRIDDHAKPVALALTQLLGVIEQQGEFARIANDAQSDDAKSNFAALRSALNLQVSAIGAVKIAADSTTAAIADIRGELGRQARSLAGIAGAQYPAGIPVPVVQESWNPESPLTETEPRSPELAPQELAALPAMVTVLLFASEPRDQDPVDLDKEIREIMQEIDDARFGDRITLRSWLATQAFDLIPNLNRHRPHMVQFSGHGEPDGVLMMGPRDRSEPLATDRLIQMFKWTCDDLRIVFYNICDSEMHARATADLVEASIGMRGAINDMSARTFAGALYSGLAFGRSVHQAFQQACAAIGDLPDRSAPQLFFREDVDPHKVVLVRPDD